MIFARHPEVALSFVQQLQGSPETPYLSAAASAARVLTGTMGFDPPSWQALCEGARPEVLEPDEFEPGMERGGWQHEASSRLERQFREEVLFERMTPRDRALVRSQSGPGGSMALTTSPTCWSTKIPHICSGWCCCAASASPFLCPRMRAGVAVQSIRLATTALHVPGQGLWGGGGLRWRALPPACAGRQGDA